MRNSTLYDFYALVKNSLFATLSETNREAMILLRKTRKTGSGANDELSLYDCDIPSCLLTEILIRLPLKSIFIFKTVSKRWLSVISDPFFARSYVTRINNDSSLSRSHQTWLLLYPYFIKNPPIQYPAAFNPAGFSDISCSAFSLSFLAASTEDLTLFVHVIASSNGLVLCCRQRYLLSTYYVCNPLTRQYVVLPKPPSFRNIRMDAGIMCRDDRSHTVVRIPNAESSSKMLELEIFSSETGIWRELSFPVHTNYSRSNHIWCYDTVSYNGILHWTADKKMFAYDPYRTTGQFYSMDLPKQTFSCLGVCCGRLCFLSASDSLVLWELTDYDLGKWHLKHTSKLSDMLSNDARVNEILQSDKPIYFFPLAIYPFKLDTVYVYLDHRLRSVISYNFRTQMLEIVDSGLIPFYLHPFVLPPWPTLIPQPSWDPIC